MCEPQGTGTPSDAGVRSGQIDPSPPLKSSGMWNSNCLQRNSLNLWKVISNLKQLLISSLKSWELRWGPSHYNSILRCLILNNTFLILVENDYQTHHFIQIILLLFENDSPIIPFKHVRNSLHSFANDSWSAPRPLVDLQHSSPGASLDRTVDAQLSRSSWGQRAGKGFNSWQQPQSLYPSRHYFPFSISHQLQENLSFLTSCWQPQFANLSLAFWESVSSFHSSISESFLTVLYHDLYLFWVIYAYFPNMYMPFKMKGKFWHRLQRGWILKVLC